MKQKWAPNPIVYYGGVMDEETRPLLIENYKHLKEGEGLLVVFPLKQGEDPTKILESDLKSMTGKEQWDYLGNSAIDKGTSTSAMQTLVDGIFASANSKRLPNVVLAQGDAKIKADDQTHIGFGVIGKGQIREIKGVIHKQLNMGLNGDIMMHEGDIIFKAFKDNGLFIDPQHRGYSRPLHVVTYGAGGSSHQEVYPKMQITSNGVIDMRTHVHPRCVIKYLSKAIDGIETPNEQLHKEFLGIKAHINERLLDQENIYTGVEIISDISKLTDCASKIAGATPQELMKDLKNEDKEYYSEITFSTPESIYTIRRFEPLQEPSQGQSQSNSEFISYEKDNFKGNSGCQNAMKAARDFLHTMAEASQTQTHNSLELMKILQGLAEKIHDLEAQTLEVANTNHTSNYRDEVEHLNNFLQFSNAVTEAIKDSGLVEKIEGLKNLETLLYIVDGELKSQIESQISIQSRLNELSESIKKSYTSVEKELEALKKTSIYEKAYDHLQQTIDYARGIYDKHQEYLERNKEDKSPKPPFEITASGNLFFTAKDKEALTALAVNVKTVEMENQLFFQLTANAAHNQDIPVEKVYVTKIAADPYKIPDPVTEELNDWAREASMPLESYVEAWEWTNTGQKFDTLPNSGRWSAAENIVKQHENAQLFYNIDKDPNTVTVVNPYWKEIGIDLLPEIESGKAFKGKIWKDWAQSKENQLKIKSLIERAKNAQLIAEPKETKEAVKEVFREYLNLGPMKEGCQEGQYKLYARASKGINESGQVQPLHDWDQAIYKSTNTAVLSVEAGDFVTSAETQAQKIRIYYTLKASGEKTQDLRGIIGRLWAKKAQVPTLSEGERKALFEFADRVQEPALNALIKRSTQTPYLSIDASTSPSKETVKFAKGSAITKSSVDQVAQHNTNSSKPYADKLSGWQPQEITAKDLATGLTFAPDAGIALGLLAGSFKDPLRAKWQAWEEEKFPGTSQILEHDPETYLVVEGELKDKLWKLLDRIEMLWDKQDELEDKHLRPSRKFLLEKSEQFKGNRFMKSFIDKLSWRKKSELDDLKEAQFALENFQNRIEARARNERLTVDDIEWANKHLKKIEDQLAYLSNENTTQLRTYVSAKQQIQLRIANQAIATAQAQLQAQQGQTPSLGSRVWKFVTRNKAITEKDIAGLEKERDELSKGILSTVAVGPKGSRKIKKTNADVILTPDGTPQGLRINRRKTKGHGHTSDN